MALDNVYQVSFNNALLGDVDGVTLYNHDFNKLPSRAIKAYKIAHRSKSVVVSSEYTSKDVPVYADVCAGSREDTENSVIALRALVQGQNGLLQVLKGGDVTQYTATMNEFNVQWNGANAYCEIIFFASDPIGESAAVTELLDVSGVTTATSTHTFNVLGSFDAEPIITVTINSITGGTAKTLQVYDATTGQGISLTRTFSAGDIIEIDCKTYKVEVNSVLVDYSGIFLTFPAGIQSLTHVDDFTTRDIDIFATYKKRTV